MQISFIILYVKVSEKIKKFFFSMLKNKHLDKPMEVKN